MSFIARTPEVPYYAVIFTSERTAGDNGYAKMADTMVELAADQPGFIGVESVRNEAGEGITVSYWESLESIANWKSHAVHRTAQKLGKSDWYQRFQLRVCKVERDKYYEM